MVIIKWIVKLYYQKCNTQNKTDMNKEKEFYRTLPPVDFSLADAEKSDVTYNIFNHPDQKEGKLLSEESVTQEKLNKNIPTILLIHGWTTDDTSPWYRPLKDGFFHIGPHNIIYVNWSKAGNKSYDVSSANVKPVGKFVAEFLVASGLPQENVHIIGHSLGSHMSGFIGKYTLELSGKKIGRITALDPAGPKFEHSLTGSDHRLSEHDAAFVDVIHTDIQFYGYTAPIGHVDFYPNEGKHQIGCPPKVAASDEVVNCSHARSTLYFVESVSKLSKAYEAYYEEDNHEVTIKVKENPREIIFGHHTDKSAKGVFYFETNSEPPFLK